MVNLKKAIRAATGAAVGSADGGVLGFLACGGRKREQSDEEQLTILSKLHATICVLADVTETAFHNLKETGKELGDSDFQEFADLIKDIWIRGVPVQMDGLDDSEPTDHDAVN